MRIFTIVLNSDGKEKEKFEILDSNFTPPTEGTTIVLKRGPDLTKASVIKIENVLERVGEQADYILNIFVKILPEEQNVN